MYRMIDVVQYRAVIGCFCFKTKGNAIPRPKGNLICTRKVAAKGIIIILCALLLLLCGDIEVNPDPKGKKNVRGVKN